MDIENNIDYNKLFSALSYYKRFFQYKDLQWTVSKEISSITKPEENNDFFFKDEALVGSGEQSFIHLMMNNELNKNITYFGITPCFRDEEKDDLHNHYFMKLEIFRWISKPDNIMYNHDLRYIMKICENFFTNYIPCKNELVGFEEFDIVDTKNNIELGSYGIREHDEYTWIYGTGCAEPRLTRAINLLNEKSI